MNLILRPVDVVFSYYATFEEPRLDRLTEDARIDFARKLLKAFNLRLNDLKYNSESLSDRFVTFSVFVNPGFFDVSLGMEEVSVSFRNPVDEGSVVDLCGRLFEIIDSPFSLQRMTLNEQHSVEGDVNSYLISLHPHTPEKFGNMILGRGVIYNLSLPEHNLMSHITVSTSHFVQGGLFLYTQGEFSPNKYDFHDAFDIARNHYQFVLDELKLSVIREG